MEPVHISELAFLLNFLTAKSEQVALGELEKRKNSHEVLPNKMQDPVPLRGVR